jgi:hypothetical protein
MSASSARASGAAEDSHTAPLPGKNDFSPGHQTDKSFLVHFFKKEQAFLFFLKKEPKTFYPFATLARARLSSGTQ